MRFKQIREKYETELSNIGNLEKTLWQALNEENGLNNLRCWNISCQLSIELTKLGEKLIKEDDFDQAEMYLMRAQQFTEPALDKMIWINQIEWFYQRLNIALNLQVIYYKQKRYSTCFDVLNQITEQCEQSHLFESIWQNIESNIDFAYYQLLVTSMEQQKYIEAFSFCKKCISIIDFYEREYSKQKKMVENDQQELLLQNYGSQKGNIYLQYKQLLQKKLILRIYCFYQGGRSLHKTGNKADALKFFKMAWKKSVEMFKKDEQKIVMFQKRYEKLKNELEFDKNLNNESIDDFSKFTLDVKRASNLQKMNFQNQQLQKKDSINKSKSPDIEQNVVIGSANSIEDIRQQIQQKNQQLNLPETKINADSISDFLFTQNSSDRGEKRSKQPSPKLKNMVFQTFGSELQGQDKNGNLQEDMSKTGEFNLMLKRAESAKLTKKKSTTTQQSTHQTTNVSPKKTFSTNTTPKNSGKNAINSSSPFQVKQEQLSPYQKNGKSNLKRKKNHASAHQHFNFNEQQNNNKFGNKSNGVSPKGGIDSAGLSFSNQVQNRNNFQKKPILKKNKERPQTSDPQKYKKKVSSLEGFTINSNSSMSYQNLDDDDNQFREQDKDFLDGQQGQKGLNNLKKLDSQSPLNNSYQDLLVKFHYPKKSINNAKSRVSRVQKSRPLTANPSRANSAHSNDKKLGQSKISQFLGSLQISSQANSVTGSQIAFSQAATNRMNTNEYQQELKNEQSNQKTRNQLSNFLQGRKKSMATDGVKQIRKHYENIFGKSADMQDDDKTVSDQTANTGIQKRDFSQGQKNARSYSNYQNPQGIDIVTALDMNKFLQNQQNKYAVGPQSSKSGGRNQLNQQSAKSFISNLFNQSQHSTTTAATNQLKSRPSSSYLKQKSKDSMHATISSHTVSNNNNTNINTNPNTKRSIPTPTNQILSRRQKGSVSQHIFSNQFYFPNSVRDNQISNIQSRNGTYRNQSKSQYDQTNLTKNQTDNNQQQSNILIGDEMEICHGDNQNNANFTNNKNHNIMNSNNQVNNIGNIPEINSNANAINQNKQMNSQKEDQNENSTNQGIEQKGKKDDGQIKAEVKQVNFLIENSKKTENSDDLLQNNGQIIDNNTISIPYFQMSEHNLNEAKMQSNHKLKFDLPSQNSFANLHLNMADNKNRNSQTEKVPSVKNINNDQTCENQQQSSQQNMGNLFFINATNGKNSMNRLMRKATLNPNLMNDQGNDEFDYIETRGKKSQTIDYSHKQQKDKNNIVLKKSNFINTDQNYNNDQQQKDKKSKIYKQIDEIFSNDPMIQSKLNTQILKLQTPETYSTNHQRQKIFSMHHPDGTTSFQQNQEQKEGEYGNQMKFSNQTDNGIEQTEYNRTNSQDQAIIKNDANLIDYVQQQKLSMFVLSRPVSGLPRQSKSKSPEGNNKQIDTLNRGQKYQQMIDGMYQDHPQQSYTPSIRMRDKKESVGSTLNLNSFYTHHQHSINQDTRSFTRNIQQSEININQSNHYKQISNSGFSKQKKSDQVASFTNLTQHQISQYYSTKKVLLNQSQSGLNSNIGTSSNQTQAKQSLSKQNSITGIGSKKLSNLAGNSQQLPLYSKINAKTVVSLAAMPEDVLDEEDEQGNHKNFVSGNLQSMQSSDRIEVSQENNSKLILSKSQNNNNNNNNINDLSDSVIQNETSIQRTDIKKLKLKVNQISMIESQQGEEILKKVNLSLLSLTESNQSSFCDSSSQEKMRSSSISPHDCSIMKKRRKSDDIFQRRSTLRDSQSNQKKDLKNRVIIHRQSVNDMINQKRNMAAILIQQFWRSFHRDYQNMGNDQKQISIGTGNYIENQAGGTSILENNKNNTSNIQNYNNSSNFIALNNNNNNNNNNSNTHKFSNPVSNLYININPSGSQSNSNIRQKKKSENSFQSQLSIQKKPGLSFMQNLSPSPNKYLKSQHFFPPTISEVPIPQSQASQQNISHFNSQYSNSLQPHPVHSFHRSASISSHKIMSFFTDPKKKKQAIEARKVLNEVQIKPCIPLKFYLFQYQKGLSLWKISNLFAHFTVQSDDVFVTMKFEIDVNKFKGILLLKFKMGVQDMVSISLQKIASKWTIASLLLDHYFKSKNIFKKWEEYQQKTKNPDNHISFLLLDGMEKERDYLRWAEEKAAEQYELENNKPFKFRSDQENYLEEDDAHISELSQLFEKLSFFIPSYTLFINKISGQAIEVVDSGINQMGYGSSLTSIIDLQTAKHSHYENNIKQLRAFKLERRKKIRQLSMKNQFFVTYNIDKNFHMVTNANISYKSNNQQGSSQNKNSSNSKKISSSCSIDDNIGSQKQLQLQYQSSERQSSNNLLPNLNISQMKKNSNWQKDGNSNFLKFIKNESGIDSPLTPIKIFGKEQDTINMIPETLETQGYQPVSYTSIVFPNNYQKVNCSIQSLDLQSELMFDENSIRSYKEKESSINSNIVKQINSSKSLVPQNLNTKKYSSIQQQQLSQQLSPQQSRSPQMGSQLQIPLQQANNMMGGKNGSRRSSLFFQKMMEQKIKDNFQNLQGGNAQTEKQESTSSPKKSIGADFQDYIEDNSIIPTFLHTTPKNSQQPYSPLQPRQSEFMKSPTNFHHKQQYFPLSQSVRVQPKNQISFFEEEYQRDYNDSVDFFKKNSEQLINQDSNDSDQHLLNKQLNFKLDTSSYSPNHHLNEESIDTPLFYHSEYMKHSSDQYKPYQNIKRGFKKATTIVEENQEDVLQQSAYQTNNQIKSTISINDSNQIIDMKEQETSSDNEQDQKLYERNIIQYEEMKRIENERIKNRLNRINYWRQFHYFEPRNNNKNVYIPESYYNPFQQNQVILKTIVKKNKEFYLAVLRICHSQDQEEFIDIEKREGVNVVLQLFQFNLKGRWEDQMSLNLFFFIEEFFQSNDLDMLKPPLEEDELGENQEFQLNYKFQKAFKFNKFLYNGGFDIKQSTQVIKQLQGKINIENCKVNLIQTNTYRRQLKQEKQSSNPYHNISEDNIIENHQTQNEFGSTLSGIKETQNMGDSASAISSDNTSHLISQATIQKEDYSKFLIPKQRNPALDIHLIKDILEVQDIRPILQIIFSKNLIYESDSKYFNVRLDNKEPTPSIKSLTDFSISKKESEGAESSSKKSVNFKNLRVSRTSISLLSRVLKASAKLKQNVLKVERNVNQTSIDQNNEHVSRVEERTIIACGDIEVLEYYNTAKKIKLDKIRFMHQIRDKQSGYIQSIRIKFSRNKTNTYYGEGELTAVVKIENHLNQYGFEQVIIKGQENIEKLINIIQYSSETQIPVFKLNLLHKNIGFFSRLYFNSYIEHNKDSHLNKFLQKYNEKDEALYDLLKNAKSLLQEPSYLQLFLTRIKLTLISNFLSSHKHEQNFLLTTYFNSQKCSQQCKIKDFGRAMIQTVVYSTNPMFTSDKSVFICLHIFSKKMRNTYSKLIFTIEDIQHLISKEFTAETCLDKDKIIKMVYLLSEKIVYFNSRQFANFKLPLYNLNKNSKKNKYDLLNSFDPTPEPLALTKSILTNKTLLTPVLRSQKVIFTCVKKISGHFSIITVRRFDILDYHCIEIYIPKSGRKWSTNIYQSDLWKFSGNFMESLFPFIYWEHQNVYEIIRSFKRERYLDFTKKYEYDIITNPQKYIDKINYLQQDHDHKFYTSVNYISQTKFKYEKYYEQYSNKHLAQSGNKQQRKLTFSQNSTEEKNDRSNPKSIISLQNIHSHTNIPASISKGNQGKTLTFNKDQNNLDKKSNTPISYQRKSNMRQPSILKNSKSIGFTNSHQLHQEEEESVQELQDKQQQRASYGRNKLHKQLTFNEFLIEKNYVNTINPKLKSSKEILEESSSNDFYYSSYVKQRKVSFDQFSYHSKPNQFLKLFEKNQHSATDVLEIKIWEKLINRMEVRVNEQGKLLVVIDSFKGLLKEILSTFVIHLRSEDNVQIQVSIEKQPQKIKSKMLLYLHSPKFEQNYMKSGHKRKKQTKQKKHNTFFSNSSNQSKQTRKSQFQRELKSNSSLKSDDVSSQNSSSMISDNSDNNSSSLSSSSSSSSSYDNSPKVNNSDDDYKKISIQQRGSDSINEEPEDYFKQMKKRYEQEFLEKEMLGTSVSLYLEEAIKWDVFIRINFFEKLQTENEKISMNLLLQQYFNENKNRLSQFTERFRSQKRKSAPRRIIQKPISKKRTTPDNLLNSSQSATASSNPISILDKIRNKVSSLKNKNEQSENKATMMIQKSTKSVMINSPLMVSQAAANDNFEYQQLDDEEQEDDSKNNIFPENYCFVNSDFLAMAGMIKNKVRENYLPSSLYEDEEYYLQEQKKQGKAFKHFENVLSANRVRRNTIAVVLADGSPSNKPEQRIGKRSFLAPYQSDQAPQTSLLGLKQSEQSLDKSVNSSSMIKEETENQQIQSNSSLGKPQFQNIMKQSIQAVKLNDKKVKQQNNVSFISNDSAESMKKAKTASPTMSRLSGFNSRLKSILLAQPSYFSNIEEAVKFEPKVKINCEISIQRLIDPEQKHFIVMYRGVFTKKPLQMIAIYYKTSKRKFYAEIWNIATQKKVKQKIKFKQICYQIPYVKQLLQLKQYSEIGRRIYLTFKNTLMISTYYLVNS